MAGLRQDDQETLFYRHLQALSRLLLTNNNNNNSTRLLGSYLGKNTGMGVESFRRTAANHKRLVTTCL